MKIAIFTDTFTPQVNGVTKTLNKLKEYMDLNGIEYKFFVPAEGDPSNTQRTISFYSIRFHLYPECKIALPRYGEVKSVLDNFKPDLIHIVTPFSVGLMGLKYGRENRIPIVSSYHTNFVEYFKYYKLQFLEGFYWKYFNWFHSFCHINFCPSLDTLTKLQKKGITNLKIWDRGIEANLYTPENYSKEIRGKYVKKDEKLILYVGRIAAEKELDVLLKAAIILNQKNSAYKLLIIGEGPQLDELKELSIPNVIFGGYKFGHELQQIYASADVFAFPSSTETYGNVILEAMASGLSVIATYEGGVKENLLDGINGLTFKAGSSLDMANKIETLLNNHQLRISLAQNAREHAIKKSWHRVFERLFADYQSIVNTAKGKTKNLSA